MLGMALDYWLGDKGLDRLKNLKRQDMLTADQFHLGLRIAHKIQRPWLFESVTANIQLFRECLIQVLEPEDMVRLGLDAGTPSIGVGYPVEALLLDNFRKFPAEHEIWERLEKAVFSRQRELEPREYWNAAADGHEPTEAGTAPLQGEPEDFGSTFFARLQARVSDLMPSLAAPSPDDPDYDTRKKVWDMRQAISDPEFRGRMTDDRLKLLEVMTAAGVAYEAITEAALGGERYLRERIVSILTSDNRKLLGLDPDRSFNSAFPAEKVLARGLDALSVGQARMILDDLNDAILLRPDPRAGAEIVPDAQGDLNFERNMEEYWDRRGPEC